MMFVALETPDRPQQTQPVTSDTWQARVACRSAPCGKCRLAHNTMALIISDTWQARVACRAGRRGRAAGAGASMAARDGASSPPKTPNQLCRPWSADGVPGERRATRSGCSRWRCRSCPTAACFYFFSHERRFSVAVLQRTLFWEAFFGIRSENAGVCASGRRGCVGLRLAGYR